MKTKICKSNWFLSFICFFFIMNDCFSANLGTWNIFNIRGIIFDDIGFMSEFQLRSYSFFDEFFYYELKGGINYALSENFTFLVGTGFYHTFPKGGGIL